MSGLSLTNKVRNWQRQGLVKVEPNIKIKRGESFSAKNWFISYRTQSSHFAPNPIIGGAQVLCEVVNENVANQSTETMPSSLPALPLEEGGVDDNDKQN